jgi:hypothetical protein
MESDGTPLYITRVRYDDGVHTAMAGEHFIGSPLAFDGKEILINVSYGLMVLSAGNVLTLCLQNYEVLCLN